MSTQRNSTSKTVCFSCMTPYHLFIAYILSVTEYKADKKILILSDYHPSVHRAYSYIIRNLKLWDKVILIQERATCRQLEGLKAIDFNNLDVIHYFTYSSYNLHLFSMIKQQTKIILTDEGIITYFIKECLEARRVSSIDVNRLSEIWVLDKRLYTSTLKKPVRNVGLETFFKDKDLSRDICKNLNSIFYYTHKDIADDVVFFDQPLSKSNIISTSLEHKLLRDIYINTIKYKVAIKKHPSDLNLKYSNLPVNIIQDDGVPWELVLLNQYINNSANLNNKVFIGYNSAALINTRILYSIFQIPCKSIFLYKLLGKAASNKAVQKFISKFKETYSEKMYDLSSIEDLKVIIDL